VSIFTRPTVRYESARRDTSPVEARLMTDGRIRLMTDPDSMHIHSAYLTPVEARDFALELAGLADVSEVIYQDGEA
jgi:hypothetical protein